MDDINLLPFSSHDLDYFKVHEISIQKISDMAV